jgi:glycosyltransferase involved in cell wall biosynthesis
MSETRVLVLTGLWPHPNHSTRAANVVTFELISQMTRFPGFRVGLLKLSHGKQDERTEEENDGIRALVKVGVDVLQPFHIPNADRNRNRWARQLFPKLSDYYPQTSFNEHVEKAIGGFRPDILFIPWSEWITALCADVKVPKFAYYGNPDPKSALIRLDFSHRHGRMGALRFLLSKNNIRRFERLHLNVMRKYELLGDVAKNDAEYYSHKGHPNAFYIQNVWIDRVNGGWEAIQADRTTETGPAVIIGNVGKLGGTANTMGLEILGRDLVPRLRERLDPGSYELRILGAGSFDPAIANYFSGADIKVTGFVPDIDGELRRSSVFLCVNNASDYKVGHTRYLHAWSLGCCVAAHVDCALSMPEIQHRRNALLGRNADEIADLVAEALSNKRLREETGRNGYQTFKQFFTAEKVVPKIGERISNYMEQSSWVN